MKTNIFRNNCLLSREGQHFHNRMLQLTVFVQTRYFASLMVAAAMLFAACSKDDAPPIQQHDTEYTFEIGYYEQLENLAQIKASADSAEVRKIYFVPQGTWERFSSNGISNLRKNALEPALAAAAPKGSGKGNWADINITPTDSLWLVQQGWTVNQ